MKASRSLSLVFALTVTLGVGELPAQQRGRTVPARRLVGPDTVSPPMRALVDAPPSPLWDLRPKSALEWKALVRRLQTSAEAGLPAYRQRLGVTLERSTIAGVRTFVLTPRTIAPENCNRLLLHLHGGGYVLFPGESGTYEAVRMAAHARVRVISVDYRMPPDHPYPAALDDAIEVWKEIIKTTRPKNVAVLGSSTGGGLTLALVLRAKKEGLPLPGAIAPGTPWSDLTKTGDTYQTNEGVDNQLVSYDGLLGEMAKLYAHGRDLREPLLSPVYGDYHGLPPAILTSGTRDLFLSNTVRVHRKLRAAGVVAELHVFEGQSHGQYSVAPDAPETKEYFAEHVRFFDQHLGR
jgi:epsilon-lactone hydrolase